MKFDPSSIHHRRSIRLKGFDYSSAGSYFITLITYGRQCLFGTIHDENMLLNAWGEIVQEEWERSPLIRGEIGLGEFVVMPNHLHGIVHIIDDPVGAYGHTPLQQNQPLRSPSKTIGALVRGFKSTVTKRINIHRQTLGIPVWQRNYYEHIIRNQSDFERISKYIHSNPQNWNGDDENLSV